MSRRSVGAAGFPFFSPPCRPTRKRGDNVEFTENQQDILYRAWLLSRRNCGQVLERWAYPDAVELEDAGWLERRYVDATGDWSWHWTPQAETALDMNALRRNDPADLN
jgi:hypothetical protein